MTLYRAYIEGIGLLGPGIDTWSHGSQILAGNVCWLSERTVLSRPVSLPSAERRRASPGVMAALEVGHAACTMAGIAPSEPLSVFASSGADGRICHNICSSLAASETEVSPTQFHNSVHNAISGYWGIASGAMTASSVVCAHDASFAAGLLEALMLLVSEQQSVLLIACDSDYPKPLYDARPVPDTFAVALLLTPRINPDKNIATLEFCADSLKTGGKGTDDRLEDVGLEGLQCSIPAARSLPLLQAVVRNRTGFVDLEYVNGAFLRLGVIS